MTIKRILENKLTIDNVALDYILEIFDYIKCTRIIVAVWKGRYNKQLKFGNGKVMNLNFG